jgi:valyl-tRNA synthetase
LQESPAQLWTLRAETTITITTEMLARNSKKMRYEAGEIEAKWQQSWEEAGVFTATRDQSKPKYYVLEMFPYPSGKKR